MRNPFSRKFTGYTIGRVQIWPWTFWGLNKFRIGDTLGIHIGPVAILINRTKDGA